MLKLKVLTNLGRKATKRPSIKMMMGVQGGN